MSSLSVERSLRNQIDHLATILSKIRRIAEDRPSPVFSGMVQNAGDVPYSTALPQTILDNLEANVGRIKLGSIKAWIDAFNLYYSSDASLSGVTDLVSALAYYQMTVPSEFADMYYASTGTRLSSSLIWPGSYMRIGKFIIASSSVSTLLVGQQTPDSSTRGEGAIRLQTENTIGSTDLQLTSTLTRADGTTYSWTITVPGSSPPNTEITLIGSLAGSSISGTTITTSTDPATLGLVAGQRMIVRSANGTAFSDTAYVETVQVVSIAHPSNYTITTSPAIKNVTGFGSTLYIEPCWKTWGSVAAVTSNDGDKFNIMYAPDRNFDYQFTHTW